VLLAFGTGLRMSELFGLKWHDIDFQNNEISVTRSIVFQVVGPCKTEASQKPVPLDPRLAEALHAWRRYTSYRAADDWVFASPAARGQKPYWGQCLMRTIIRPAAAKIGITQHIGWHTFRHYAESSNMPHRVFAKQGQHSNPQLIHFRYPAPMRHSPVCCQRLLRNPRSSSLARYSPRLPFMGVVFAKTFSFKARSASR
jgi:integrase